MIRIDVESFKQCFKEKEGVVINTFHGVKGEEYTTVIAFGLLYGYVPHWNIINNKPLRYAEHGPNMPIASSRWPVLGSTYF